MSDKKISDLVELGTLAADDVLPVVDSSANATKRVTYDTLATEVRTESEPLSATTVTASGDVSAPTATIAGDITSNGETVYHRGNVVGTVSQSGGTPTGAVVERGENGNGQYVRYADGTQICWQRGLPNTSSSTLIQWDYPKSFVSTASLAVTATKDCSPDNAGFVATVLKTPNHLDYFTSNAGNTVEIIAVGRWF